MTEHMNIVPAFVIHNVAHLWTTYQMSGLSRKEIASMAQVSERAIRKYENSSQLPSRKVYNKLAAVLGWEAWK